VIDRPLLDVLAVLGAASGVLGLAYGFAVQARTRTLRRQLTAFLANPVVGDARRAVQRVGVVRYDAFPDAGGRLSYSVALLDGAGDGVVLTTITGRSETRSYAKEVRSGAGADPTSPEEDEAIGQALGRR
jgi:hypothetical protein